MDGSVVVSSEGSSVSVSDDMKSVISVITVVSVSEDISEAGAVV